MKGRQLLAEEALEAVVGRTIGASGGGEVSIAIDGHEFIYNGMTLYLNGGGNISFYEVPDDDDPEGEGVGIVFYPDGLGAEDHLADLRRFEEEPPPRVSVAWPS